MSRGSALLVAILAAAVIAACVPGPAATFEPGVEHVPGPGYIHIVTQPPTAELPLTFVLIVPDGTDSTIGTTVAGGDPVVVDLTALPGSFAIRMNGTVCDGRFPVESDRETDVVVRITADGCAATVGPIHDPVGAGACATLSVARLSRHLPRSLPSSVAWTR